MTNDKVGIIYLMKSVIKGVYKIGISSNDNFESRMYNLEKNGYDNIAGLKRVIAIKTENYQAKEKMIHEIFSKSRIAETEFFAVDRNLVEQLFYSLKGEVIFPKKVDSEKEIEEIVERQEEELGRRDFINFVKENHKRNPQVIRNILGEKNEFNEHGNRAKVFREPKVSPGGTVMTEEIDDGIYIFINYSRKDSAKAKQDFEKIFGDNK